MERRAAVTIVRQSWQRMEGRRDGFGSRFYGALFGEYPQLRSLFPSSMVDQERKLEETLAIVVRSAEAHNGELAHLLAELGKRHKGYGACKEHYAVVQRVLLEVLAEDLGAEWDERTQSAWRCVLESVSAGMLKAGLEACDNVAARASSNDP